MKYVGFVALLGLVVLAILAIAGVIRQRWLMSRADDFERRVEKIYPGTLDRNHRIAVLLKRLKSSLPHRQLLSDLGADEVLLNELLKRACRCGAETRMIEKAMFDLELVRWGLQQLIIPGAWTLATRITLTNWIEGN